MALLLERMAETGAPFSALVAALPRYSRRLTAVRFEHGRLGLMIQGLEQEFPDARTDRTDGLKLHVAEGWVHVRASNTEPLLRIAIEARDVKGVDALEARVNTALA
jgi:phosphomannomutase